MESRTRILPTLVIALAALAQSAIAEDARLLVVNKSDSTLSIVDPASLEVIASVPTGYGPHEVTVSADGTIAYVSNYGDQPRPGSSISIIDIAAAKEIRQVELSLLRPHGIVESNGSIWFTAEGSQTIARYDPAANKIDWKVKTGQEVTHMVVVAPRHGKVYASNIGSHTVTVASIEDKSVRQIETGRGPEGIDLSPDGSELWVGNREDGTISIIDVETDLVKATFEVGNFPIRVRFTPDGRRVLISDAALNELIVIDAVTCEVVRRIPTGDMPVGILVEPDGRRAWVAATMADEVIVIDLEKLEMVGTISPGITPDGMAWAVMGRRENDE